MTARATTRSTRRDPVRVAAAGAAGICVAFAGVQAELAAGAPFGEHVWGDSQNRVLPTNMRIISAGAAVVLTGMATTVARRGGLLGRPARWQGPATWAIAGYLALNTVGNLASTDDVERFLFGTAIAVASALTAFVAHRTRTGEVPHKPPRQPLPEVPVEAARSTRPLLTLARRRSRMLTRACAGCPS